MSSVRSEIARRSTARDRVLSALVAAGARGVTNIELATPQVGGMRFGGRIHELRNAGHLISDAQHVDGGVFRYVYGVAATGQVVLQPEAPPARFVPPVHMPVYTSAPRVTPPRPSRTTSVQGELF